LIAVIADSVAPGRHAEMLALFEAIDEVHPTEPHWYLPLIGVDADSQGYGLGAMLLRTTLALCDRDGLPASLETSNPGYIPFYERHGFRQREALCEGSCPPIVLMWRRPAHGPGWWPGYAES
jgi:GNAT superfamily N-acetyltransferase